MIYQICDIVMSYMSEASIDPIQDEWGGGQNGCFSPITNVGFSLQNFLTFNFNPFATLVKNFKIIELEPKPPLKKWSE